MPRLTFFHLFYSTTFTLLSLVTLALVLVPPGDAIAQTFNWSKQFYNVFVVVGAYVLTALVAVVLYTSRLYTFRRLLASIPKEHAPVGKADLPNRVHAAVTSGISRSANIAFISRPDREKDGAAMWGVINHPGWAPPGGELRGVEYRTIVLELPVLLEQEAAEMVALGGLDPGVVARLPQMTLRQWVENLVGMDLAPGGEAEGFLTIYERARFRMRGKGIEEGEFRGLMKALKALLSGMGAASRRYGPDVGAWQYAMGAGRGDGEYASSVVHVEPTVEYPQSRDIAFGAYDAHSNTDYGYDEDGYTPDSRTSSTIPVGIGRAASSTLITPPKRRRPDSSAGESSLRRGGDDGEGVEMVSTSRGRRLSLRASAGTFG